MTDTAPSTSVAELVTNAAAVVGAVLTLGGLAWWLIRPRLTAWLEQLVAAAEATAQELDPTELGSTAANVRLVRELAADIPALVARVGRVERELDELAPVADLADRNANRLESHEATLIDHRRRLGNLEEAAITGRFRHDSTMEPH